MNKKIYKLIIFLIFLCQISFSYSNEKNNKTNEKEDVKQYKIIESKNMKDHKESQMDINNVTKEEMVAYKISIKIANGILEYRDITGGFDDISELKRIKGVGPASYNIISKQFKIIGKNNKKNLNINKADITNLTYYGFTKVEIIDIQKYIKQNRRIRNNLDLMKILSKKRYEEYKSIIIYENFNK
ncbi:MAG: helix-hairpin-helix domain-containing protein [Fusobacteriaceae bacterium]|jgi:competence protein ComEA|nr:helix-hairpin-helix domain-containing protein [Fusobacteriaceae bacterium]